MSTKSLSTVNRSKSILSRSVPDSLDIASVTPDAAHKFPVQVIVVACRSARGLARWAAGVALEIVPETLAEGREVGDTGRPVNEPFSHAAVLLVDAAVGTCTSCECEGDDSRWTRSSHDS